MATPSSSATSPSPPLAYLSHNPVLSSSRQIRASSSQTISDNELRDRAIKKFLVRAEVSTVTRALRTRLSYASYKATHNVPHANLQELETYPYSQPPTASLSRTIPAKRKAAGPYHSTHLSASGSSVTPGSIRRAGSTSMPPPTSSPRAHHISANGVPTIHGDTDAGPRNSGSSLYASLLSPLATQQARTIHNAMDPPVPAASRPLPSPRPRSPKHAVRGSIDGSRSTAKSRKIESSPHSPNKSKSKRTSGKAKHRKRASKDTNVDTEEEKDVDMKAAATLTSLLLHNRSSIASTSSPRSSVDGSEPGSLYHNPSRPDVPKSSGLAAPRPSMSSVSSEASARTQTPPPPHQAADSLDGSSTPRPAPTDNEAASLMLFLATSPSPARPNNKESRDSAAYRALSGGSSALRDKGRVLFASGSDATASTDLPRHHIPTRSLDASYNSSVSSISSMEVGSVSRADSGGSSSVPSQLLPPPSLPSRSTHSRSPSSHLAGSGSPRATSALAPVDFNFNDFIHGSPSPLRAPSAPAPKANLGLRADVGRKLFEEEQMRQSLGSHNTTRRHDDPNLAAGIDLVQT